MSHVALSDIGFTFMHELSIAMSMIDRVLEESQNRGGARVEAVHVKVGALSGVDQDALAFSYEVACEGTTLEGSRLVIDDVPVLIFCGVCGAERTPPSIQQLCCPQCHSPAERVVRGRELEVTALELAA